jgi:DNA adenine methylase
MKPPLTYYGGKQKMSGLIIPLIPKHSLYCEPFFGGGAVYFAKPPSKIEVINDVNGEIVNFYKVVKTRFNELQSEIVSSLSSRKLYNRAQLIYSYPEYFDPVQRAWSVWVLANQSFASKLNGIWRFDKKENTSITILNNKIKSFTEEIVDRIRTTNIECADALQVIQNRDSKESFFYCDPPYFNSDKGHYKNYSQEDFEKLLHMISKIRGKFILSSYPSELLTKYSKKNNWFTKRIEMSLSIASLKNVKKKVKSEVLTANLPI